MEKTELMLLPMAGSLPEIFKEVTRGQVASSWMSTSGLSDQSFNRSPEILEALGAVRNSCKTPSGISGANLPTLHWLAAPTASLPGDRDPNTEIPNFRILGQREMMRESSVNVRPPCWPKSTIIFNSMTDPRRKFEYAKLRMGRKFGNPAMDDIGDDIVVCGPRIITEPLLL